MDEILRKDTLAEFGRWVEESHEPGIPFNRLFLYSKEKYSDTVLRHWHLEWKGNFWGLRDTLEIEILMRLDDWFGIHGDKGNGESIFTLWFLVGGNWVDKIVVG